jgi:serine/threonine-protein kinase RsbW
MAVEDACAMLVRIAAPNATLSCRFTVRADRIELAADADVDVDVDDGAEALPTGSFGWRVLSYLADEVTARVLPGEPGQHARVGITVAKDAVTTPPWD